MIKIILSAIVVSSLFAVDISESIETVKPQKAEPSLYEYEKLVKDMVYKLDRLCVELKYVKDAQTAKRAGVSINRLLVQFNNLNKKMAKMPPPSIEIQNELSKKYESDLTASATEFTALVAGLKDKAYASELLQIIGSSRN